MAGLELSITLDDETVRRLFGTAPAAIQRRLRMLIEAGAIDVQRVMRQKAHIAVTGNLRKSVRYQLDPARLQAVVWPDVPYAEDVEKGTKPHYTSVAEGASLYQWARLKGINPYALQHSIARKGTKAHPYVAPTYQQMKPIVEQDIADGWATLMQELNNGRL